MVFGMKSKTTSLRAVRRTHRLKSVLLLFALVLPVSAHASLFQGETLDAVADVMTWIVLVVAPVVAIGVFLLIHIMPEKIAEKRHHPQTGAIQCLCLLSLFFGGMLWPIAWLWAYTKPVLHQMAYGTDKVVHGAPDEVVAPAQLATKSDVIDETAKLRQRIAELEAKLSGTPVAGSAKV
jgi:NADH:ubiquinone oxidoreductase subunit 6 (subunit J)